MYFKAFLFTWILLAGFSQAESPDISITSQHNLEHVKKFFSNIPENADFKPQVNTLPKTPNANLPPPPSLNLQAVKMMPITHLQMMTPIKKMDIFGIFNKPIFAQ